MLSTGVQLKKCQNIIESSSKCIICQTDENIVSVHEAKFKKLQDSEKTMFLIGYSDSERTLFIIQEMHAISPTPIRIINQI